MPRSTALLAALLTFLSACDRRSTEPLPPAAPPSNVAAPVVAGPTAPVLSERISRAGAAQIVAIGDLHGDLDVTRRALRLAGAIDEGDRWVGGKLVIVQTGDQIDRADEDRQVLDLLVKVRDEAQRAGGAVVIVNGNHELMNVALDFRYVTRGAWRPFDEFVPRDPSASAAFSMFPVAERGRVAAFAPGGTYAKLLAEQPIVMKLGDTVFVHGGILPKHVAYGLDRMNDETRAWMLGQRKEPPAIVAADDAPVWTRAYAGLGGGDACKDVTAALDALGAKRMVIGHTVQERGITHGCGDRLWRIDVGMSRFFGGPLELLSLTGDEVKLLRAK